MPFKAPNGFPSRDQRGHCKSPNKRFELGISRDGPFPCMILIRFA